MATTPAPTHPPRWPASSCTHRGEAGADTRPPDGCPYRGTLSRYFALFRGWGCRLGRALRSLFPQPGRPETGGLLLTPCGLGCDDLARNPVRDIGTGCLLRGAGKRVCRTHGQDPFNDGTACMRESKEPAPLVSQASRRVSICRQFVFPPWRPWLRTAGRHMNGLLQKARTVLDPRCEAQEWPPIIS